MNEVCDCGVFLIVLRAYIHCDCVLTSIHSCKSICVSLYVFVYACYSLFSLYNISPVF